ncbi:hypothetical protein [Saccharopolyspora phatthalungensis]|uniref:Uncharacterized protein n=1 Tax=Saccharopolyspora phatthalungensis TaxID=664693 RepID=A0A840QAR4_9PSEU|nr:hypothetical protein [Saccharopolyspora phatthalungensis]
MRTELEARQAGYVLAVACDASITTAAGRMRADEMVSMLPKLASQRLSASRSGKGHRYLRLAWTDIPTLALEQTAPALAQQARYQ